MPGQRGFTLIEIMVVMVIVGVMIGMITLVATGNRDKRELENEARRLIAVLQMAADEAVMQNLEIGLEVDAEGYTFRGFDEQQKRWIELPQSFLRDSSFPDSVAVDTTTLGAGYTLQTKPQASPGAGLDDDEQEEAMFRPQILLLSSGESSPFTLRMSSVSSPQLAYRLVSDGVNPVTLEEPDDDR